MEAFVDSRGCERSSGELYGEFNLMTSEWTDGLVPKMVRQCVQAGTEGSDNRKWIIFDGPVDAVWIENMNTVSTVRPTVYTVQPWQYTVPLGTENAEQLRQTLHSYVR